MSHDSLSGLLDTSTIAERLQGMTFEPAPIAYSYSDTQFEILKQYILDFQKSLDSEHDVGLMLTNFGKSVTMAVTHIGYEKSVLMVFKGFVDDHEATLIQHVSQLNFLLTAVPKRPDDPHRVIGFTADWD